MKLNKEYILLACGVLFIFSISLPSCNPHRAGSTASQIGAGGGKKYHRTPASAKRKRIKKYN
ncbi:MAG: hypothetical protein H6587_11430 [Flavobacteriales bacterium]|nr:hypothetical protein [Flavobacteriales bacterium]